MAESDLDALKRLIDAVERLPLESWAEDHRPDATDGCTFCGWDDIRKCTYTASHDALAALPAARAALEEHERLREEAAKLRTFILRLDPDYEKNAELSRQEIRHPEGRTVDELRAALAAMEGAD